MHGCPRESKEWMLQAALNEKVVVEEEGPWDYERRRKEEKVRNWQEKALQNSLPSMCQKFALIGDKNSTRCLLKNEMFMMQGR